MTAAETWPDGRPKSTLNPVWHGGGRLAEQLPTTVEIGCAVWERTPDQAQRQRDTGDPGDSSDGTPDNRRGGVVAKVAVDPDTGDKTVYVLKGEKAQGRFVVRLFEFSSEEIDRSTIEKRTPSRLHRAARQVFRALGEAQGAYIVGFDRYLMELAVGLVVVAEEDAAVLNAARQAHEAEKFAAAEGAAPPSDWEENARG